MTSTDLKYEKHFVSWEISVMTWAELPGHTSLSPGTSSPGTQPGSSSTGSALVRTPSSETQPTSDHQIVRFHQNISGCLRILSMKNQFEEKDKVQHW